MVNITNDAHFLKSSALYQHAVSSVFRAVENRMPVVRAANTGLSCFIDKNGRIFTRVKVGDEDISVRGYKTATIRISNERSFYTKFGDIFIFICGALLISSGGMVWRKRKRE